MKKFRVYGTRRTSVLFCALVEADNAEDAKRAAEQLDVLDYKEEKEPVIDEVLTGEAEEVEA